MLREQAQSFGASVDPEYRHMCPIENVAELGRKFQASIVYLLLPVKRLEQLETLRHEPLLAVLVGLQDDGAHGSGTEDLFLLLAEAVELATHQRDRTDRPSVPVNVPAQHALDARVE